MTNTMILLLGFFTCFCFGMLWQQNHKHHREIRNKLDDLQSQLYGNPSEYDKNRKLEKRGLRD